MELTAYHAKYFAYELTKKRPSDDPQKLGSTLLDAQVDIKPHQVDAALFAFHSPLSKGSILADEVGLGKTIEAGMVIAQKWAERKRKILVIAPANLRKQWFQELQDKFFLPSVILEKKSFDEFIHRGIFNPFDQEKIIIISYQYAKLQSAYIKAIKWDLVVIDEAHRLRNVYKPGNIIANSIRSTLLPFDKILLTATPLQNSLMELYGLVSIIDEFVFGDIKSFKAKYNRDTNQINQEDFDILKIRLRPVIQRTLRRQVQPYVSYTNRIPMVEEFYPSDDEQKLYELVSDYLQEEELYALPRSQRSLMTLILRRLLASSTFAIAGTLEALANKLDRLFNQSQVNNDEGEISNDFETYDEIVDEWEEDEEEIYPLNNSNSLNIESLEREKEAIKKYASLAKSIEENSKGKKLLQALVKGFAEMERLKAPKKALIFTESTRTQTYLKKILEINGYGGQVVLFNGSNSDADSKLVYQNWLGKHKNTDKISGSKSSDMRAALVECFKDERSIMVATEAAAEGVNLQFCSLVVNYDMPWNPQRIEQRIGRCHRYGQKHDVVVINFLNLANAADVRVYQLLNDKFHLFNLVFGASDEVIGQRDAALASIENGIGFEKKIADIYQNCRSREEIEEAFNTLQKELEDTIQDNMNVTQRRLLENFDVEVNEKLRINQANNQIILSKYENWLWDITRFKLKNYAKFSLDHHSFVLNIDPFGENNHPGPYKIGKHIEDANTYRIQHNLAQRIISECKKETLIDKELWFDYSNYIGNISSLKPYAGKQGYLICNYLAVSSIEDEENILLCGITDARELLDKEICEKFFILNAIENNVIVLPSGIEELLQQGIESAQNYILNDVMERNSKNFSFEIEKLDRWADDKRYGLRQQLKDLDAHIKEIKKSIRLAPNLPEKLKLEKERRRLESERDASLIEFESSAKKIEQEKDQLLDVVEKRLNQLVKNETLFRIRWKLI